MKKRKKERREEFFIDDTKTYKLLDISPEECDRIINEARKQMEEKKEKQKKQFSE